MELLNVDSIYKQFGDYYAVNGISFGVEEGIIFGILGPNGAGKSTTIRMITNIIQPDKGTIKFLGESMKSEFQNHLGYLPEERGLYKKIKVIDQLVYFGRLKGMTFSAAQDAARQWLRKLDAADWEKKKIQELSKGMQQKVQFVITVIHNPELLIFDEPFSGFDPVNADLLKKEILELKDAGHTIIFSTHNMSSVEEICDEIALIDHAQVVLSGHVSEVRERFRTNTFKIKIKGTALLSSADPYSILSQKQGPNSLEVLLRKNNDVSNAELLMSIMQQNEIIAFAEELPSMNEIFINTVAGKNKPQV